LFCLVWVYCGINKVFIMYQIYKINLSNFLSWFLFLVTWKFFLVKNFRLTTMILDTLFRVSYWLMAFKCCFSESSIRLNFVPRKSYLFNHLKILYDLCFIVLQRYVYGLFLFCFYLWSLSFLWILWILILSFNNSKHFSSSLLLYKLLLHSYV
jgi:hypothetical protein